MILPKIVHRPDRDRWEMYFTTPWSSNTKQVQEWCWDTFGHPGTDPDTGVKSGWDYHGSWLYFYDEKYVTMFILRWS